MHKIIFSPLIILGSGPAGYTAAIYAARANLKPLLITGMASGGQLMTTTHVDNWPADAEGVLGPDLMQRFEAHARRFGTEIQFDHIDDVALTHDARSNIANPIGPLLDDWDCEWMTKDYKILVSSTAVYVCRALIVSTGASAKYLGLPSEEEYMGRGVSGCATCDGFFYKDQEVVVVGGGNTAVEEALYLSKIASRVHLVHRRDTFRAEAIMIDHLMQEVHKGRIVLHLHQEVQEILGNEQGVNGVRLIHQHGSVVDLPVSGVFIAIGHQPNTNMFVDQLSLKHGYIVTNGYGHPDGVGSTNIPGVFAAGDCQDSIYRQAITSAGSGCSAALDAARYLQQ